MLNPPGVQTTAALVAELENTGAWPKGKDREGEPIDAGYYNQAPMYTLQFSDCDRSISYNLDFGDASTNKATLFKLNTMVDLLTKFRDGLVLEVERYEERAKLRKKKS